MFRSLTLACIWSLTFLGVLSECPKVCECKWRDGKEVVSCRDAHFIDIPRGLAPSTQVLDLRHNNLKILPKDSFVYTGLTSLQKVWLSFCNLMHIEGGAFRNLENVFELDLSNNFLRSVPSAALMDMGGIRELRLAHNSITFISSTAFLSTPELVQLDISHNSITAIEEGALRYLINLEVLDMSENKIQRFAAIELEPLILLRVINIDSNPWHCNCLLKPLRKWLDDKGLIPSPPPLCSQPRWLFGKPWQLIDLQEFICAPQVSVIAPRVLASEGENVTLVCQVRSEVDAVITWLAGDSPILNSNETVRYYVSESAVPDYNSYMSNLTMTGVVSQDQGTYRCVAENRAGYQEVNLTLQVSHEVAEVRIANVEPTTYVKSGLIMGILTVVFVVLLLSSLLYCKLRSRQSPQEDEGKSDVPLTSRPSNSDDYKLSGYHIVPTNELDDSSLRGQQQQSCISIEARGVGGGAPIEDTGRESVGRPHHFEVSPDHSPKTSQIVNVPQPAHSSVSYVEIPKSGIGAARTMLEDQVQWKDVTAHRKDIPISGCAQTTIQSSDRSSAQFPDLLDLPQSQGQGLYENGNNFPLQMLNSSYCTIPRGRSKNSADTSSLTRNGERVYDPTAQTSFSHPYDSEYRSSSALNLALSEAASQAYAQGHIPIGSHMLLPGGQAFVKSQYPQELQDFASQGVARDQECGQVGSSHDPYRFEYHAAQLEKFLQEYQSLQQQLQMMKQSYQAHRRTGSAPRLDCCADVHLVPLPANIQSSVLNYPNQQAFLTHPDPSSTISQTSTTLSEPSTASTSHMGHSTQPFIPPAQSSINKLPSTLPSMVASPPSSAMSQSYPSTSQVLARPLESNASSLQPCSENIPPYSVPTAAYSALPSHCPSANPHSYTTPLQICIAAEGEGGGERGEGGRKKESAGSSSDSRSSPLCSDVSISPPTVSFPNNGQVSRSKMLNKGPSQPKEPLKSILKKPSSSSQEPQQPLQKKEQMSNQWKS